MRRTNRSGSAGEREASADKAEIAALARRVARLEQEVQECREVNRRLAEVVDVVAELLVPAMDRDDARVAAALANLQGNPGDKSLS